MSGPDRSSPLAVGMTWVSRITGLALEFALPTILGNFVDRRFGWTPFGTILGLGVGFAVGMIHLVRMSKSGTDDRRLTP